MHKTQYKNRTKHHLSCIEMYKSLPDNDLFFDGGDCGDLKTRGCFADMCRCRLPVLPPLQACSLFEQMRQRAEPSNCSKCLQIQLRLSVMWWSSLVSLSALSSARPPGSTSWMPSAGLFSVVKVLESSSVSSTISISINKKRTPQKIIIWIKIIAKTTTRK